MKCKNCGNNVKANFCAHCGEAKGRRVPVRTYKTIIILALMATLSCNEKTDSSNAMNFVTLNIQFSEPIPIDKKIEMELTVSSKNEENRYKGKIKRRGGFSISFPKHSYNLDLKEDVSICNLPRDDDWILNANFIDKTFLRHVLSYELFSDMGANNISPKCQFVEVELNQEYNGLYVLMEKLDRSTLRINKSDSLAFIFKEPHLFRKTYEGVVPQKPKNFHQQTYPKFKKSDRANQLDKIRAFILRSSDKDFQQQFPKVFDMQNIIDWHLLLLVSNNNDGILKNFYLYKSDKQTPVRIAPWDYDHSFGRDGDNELNMDERQLKIERSILFNRLLAQEWYKALLKKRWLELNDREILSVAGLKRRVITMSQSISGAVAKNTKLWPNDAEIYYDANDFAQEIEIMLSYLDLRHKRLEDYFSEL